MRDGKFHITVDFIGHVFRTSTAGSSERNTYALDWVHALVGYVCVGVLPYSASYADDCVFQVALPIWRKWGVDSFVLKHREEHADYVREKGLRSQS